jgi:hypothetical protein
MLNPPWLGWDDGRGQKAHLPFIAEEKRDVNKIDLWAFEAIDVTRFLAIWLE